MTRTHAKVGSALSSKGSGITADEAARTVEEVLRLFSGRWKLPILFHLFGGKVQRFSDLERLIPAISQKMLAQQLRQLEADGLVQRTVYPEVPPKVEYQLTDLGQALCPALDALVCWSWIRSPGTMP